MEHLLKPINPDLDFGEKFCIFVIDIWGIAKTLAVPFYFTLLGIEKSQDVVKILRRLVEKSQGSVEIFQGFVRKRSKSLFQKPEFFSYNP